MALTPGQVVTIHRELEEKDASSGRKVQLTVTGTGDPAVQRVHLGYAWEQLATRLVYDQEIQERDGIDLREGAPGGTSFDLTVRGRLRTDWSLTPLRSTAAAIVAQNGSGMVREASPADVSVLDYDAPAVSKVYNPTIIDTDPTDWLQVIEEGAGMGVGKLYGGIGNASKNALGGFFGGLGAGWSVVLVILAGLVLAFMVWRLAGGGI